MLEIVRKLWILSALGSLAAVSPVLIKATQFCLDCSHLISGIYGILISFFADFLAK